MQRTRRLMWPWSHALATAYTYDLLALIFVYMSAILALQVPRLMLSTAELVAHLALIGMFRPAGQIVYAGEHTRPHNRRTPASNCSCWSDACIRFPNILTLTGLRSTRDVRDQGLT